MFYCKDPRQTCKQLDPPLRIEFLIMHYKLFSLEKSALPKCLLMQDRQCQTGDIDTEPGIKVRKEPQGEERGWPRSENQGWIPNASDESSNLTRGGNRLTPRMHESSDIRAADGMRHRN